MPITSISGLAETGRRRHRAGGDRSPPAVFGRRSDVLLVQLIGADRDVRNGLDDGVMTSSAIDDVVAPAAAEDRVVAVAAQDRFASEAADQRIVASAAIQRQVRTRIAEIESGDGVVTGITVDREGVVLAVMLDDDPRRQSVDDEVAVL